MRRFLSPRYLIALLLFGVVIAAYLNRAKLIRLFEIKTGLEQNEDSTDSCPKGYLFSEKDCKCVADSYRCKGLNKSNCEKNQNCFSYNRGGSCSCPACEIMLEHQCLPIDDLFQ